MSFLLPILTAVLLFFSFPGTGGLWPLVFIALTPLLFSLTTAKQGVKKAFFAGLFSGLIHFCLLLYWLTTVLGYYGGLPWYLSWPALVLLSFYMALYLAFFAAAAALFFRWLPPLVCLLVLPALWVGLDWLRSIVLTGFPWMDIGYTLFSMPILIQIADLLGHYGVSYLIIMINSALVLLFTDRGRFQRPALVVLPTLVVCLASYYSLTVLPLYQADARSKARIKVGIVQGNIDQARKWSPAEQEKTVAAYLQASKGLVNKESLVSFIVWPETAMPFYPQNSNYTADLQDFVTSLGIPLISGAPWYAIDDPEKREISYYNSAFLLNKDGSLGGLYHKTHLVPFGEYVPLARLLFFLSPLVEAVGDFSPGKIHSPMGIGAARAGVLICFESVFPKLSRRWLETDANLLVNLTNDAWYGNSSAPHHSLAMAVFRAVEARRALVRSANTGISAFIMPSGEISQQSGLFESWAAVETVPLLEHHSFWQEKGYLFAPICLGISLFCLLLVLFGLRHGRRRYKL